jgi:DNA mismatch repair protein MutL
VPVEAGVLSSPLLGPIGYFQSLRFLGQLADTYLVCEGPDGALVVLDQHAAHERVLFEQLRAARRGRDLSSQRLLVPAVVEVGPAQAEALTAHRERLTALGFEVEPFGGESFSVAAVPAVLSRAKLLPLLIDLAEQLAQVETTDAAQDAENDVLATMACHAAIRAGDGVGPEEARALFRSLDSIDFKVRCPHGRPVVTSLTRAELERRVERT